MGAEPEEKQQDWIEVEMPQVRNFQEAITPDDKNDVGALVAMLSTADFCKVRQWQEDRIKFPIGCLNDV
ncbi:uncharacterized protein PG998_011886 [Apiospora kogelbergensis]|uniref:uncharacterized protein n=1 Tax=Apiospora kogelbergensis TaxID=1337665 RepID=UPI00313003D0